MNISAKANALYTFLFKNQSKIFYSFAFVFLSLLLIVRVGMVFCYHAELMGIDNNFVYAVMRLLKSFNLYPNPEAYPYTINNYAPLFFYVSYVVCHLLGVGAGDTIQLFFVTRGLCLVFDLATMFLLFRTMRKYLQVSKHVALLTTLCYFYVISYWAYTSNRSDSMVLLFFGLILYYLLAYLQKPSALQLALLAVLCTLAFFAKQSALIAPIMVCAVLVYQGRWKPAFLFLAIYIPLFAGLFFLFTRLYPGGAFYNHLFRALNNRIDPKWYYVEIFKRLSQSYVIIPLAGGFFLSLFWLARNTHKNVTALAVSAILVTGYSAALALKWGSSVGYFHESLFCISCILAYTANQTSIAAIRDKLLLPALFVLLFIFSDTLIQLYLYHVNGRSRQVKSYQEQQQIAHRLLKQTGEDQYIFAYPNTNDNFFKLLLQDKIVAPNVDAIDCCTLPDHNFDYSGFIKGFSDGRIRYIIFSKDFVVPEMHGISFDRYEADTTIGDFTIYQFRE